MKNVEDFKKAAKERNITNYIIHYCSMCGYPCGFKINGDVVSYDNGCDCVWSGLRPSSWEELANTYNLNAGASDVKERTEKNPNFADFVKKDNEFWGF